ncbi:MAG TPA: LarC family nickel insertion protein [Geminicoccaceae bacterium]
MADHDAVRAEAEPVRHLHIDPLGGAAGDMIIAALLDAFPEFEERAVEAMRAAGLPAAWQPVVARHHDGVLGGRRFGIERGPGAADAPDNHFRALVRMLESSDLAPAVARRAATILELIGWAEAAVHGVDLERVHFHELADWDSIADVVGAATLIEALQPLRVSLAPLPLGGGRVRTRHGWLPVPAPATARLLDGLPVIDDGIGGERVTPTGAAILRHLEPTPHLPPGAWRLARTGHGFGTRTLDGISNVLRVMVYERGEEHGWTGERVGVIGFEVDDMSPEALALGVDRLRAREGVLDLVQIPAFGKKGRVAVQIQVLAREDALDSVIGACFAETTTIGLRHRIEARAVLGRRERVAEGVRVKVVERPGGRTLKVEAEDLRPLEGHAARENRRRAIERAVDEERDGPDD